MKKLVVSLVVLTIAVFFGVVALVNPVAAGGRPLTAELSGANEVPSNSSSASGSAHLTLNQGQEEICFDIALSGLVGVVAAHIHEGSAGTNGGVVVSFGSGINSDNDISGCVNADKASIKEIRQNPAGYYINVHTVAIPSGEVRGQLSK
jgi:hypothetical protein